MATKAKAEDTTHLHQIAFHANLALVPKKHRQKVDDIIAQAKAKNVGPEKLAEALMALILGGFTPAAFTHAIAILFGQDA